VAGVRRAGRVLEEQAGGHLLGRCASVVQGACRRLLPRGGALAAAAPVVGSPLRHRPCQRTHARRRELSVCQGGLLAASKLATLHRLLRLLST